MIKLVLMKQSCSDFSYSGALFHFGYIDKVVELGKYCRDSFDDDTRTNPPDSPNEIWEFHKCLRLTNELLKIFDKIVVF